MTETQATVLGNPTGMSGAEIPGWFGKVPFLGDFASRRLPPHFLTAWDHWLQHSIVASKAQLGESWTDIYLQSPFWRFMLWPGVIDNNGWAGILMPSVDSAGRYFPLTIAVQLAAQPASFYALATAQQWFTAIEQVALATLDMNFSVEQFESRLAQHAFTAPTTLAQNRSAIALSTHLSQPSATIELIQLTEELPALLQDATTQLFFARAYGCSLWWQDASTAAANLCMVHGLPPDAEFSKLLQANM